MLLFRLILALTVFSIVPMALCAQTMIDAVQVEDNSDSLIKQFLDNETFISILFGCFGLVIISSAIIYNYTVGKRQHPYRFLVQVINNADLAAEEGRLKEACQICTQAMQTINDNPKLFPVENKSRIGATWMLKRKIQELKNQMEEQGED